MMNEFLNKLTKHDSKISCFTHDKQIIHQGLAPLMALSNKSLTIQKANLLETAKHKNWMLKAGILFNQLSKNNIEFIVFKGFAFTHLLYNHSQIRPYSDIDIIIHRSNYNKVKDILIQLEYQLYPSRQGDFVSFQNSFYDNDSPQSVIDLHWEINNRIEFHQHFKFSELYNSSQFLHFENTKFKTLSNIDAFILGSFHYHAHRPEDRKHIWLYDLAILWSIMDSTTQNKCLTRAKNTAQSAIVFNTLNLLNNTFIDCFNIQFNKNTSYNEPTEKYLQPRLKKIIDIKTRLKNIPGISNKLKFIGEYIFQSTEYVMNRYQLKSNRWVYMYYPKMWLEDIARLFK